MSERTVPPEVEESTRRWMWAGVILMALFIGVFPIYRIYEPAQRADARELQMGFLADHGGELFAASCAGCHGEQGLGGLGPAIGSRNFLESVEDRQIAQLIGLGVPGTEMVGYSIDNGGPLTSTEIQSLTTYLRSLEEDSVSNPNWQKPLSSEDLTGQDLFTLACARCHGIDRTGIEDVAPDISSTSFAMDESDEWLADRISAGRKEMPRFSGVLTEGQIGQLVRFLRGLNSDTPTPPTTTTTVVSGDTTTTTAPDNADSELLALGKEIFEVTGATNGCSECHGLDAQGTSDGPNIIGSSKSAISGAIGGGVPDMADIKLTSEELEAVYRYLTTLQP